MGRGQRQPEIRHGHHLGRRHPDLGVDADHRGPGPEPDAARTIRFHPYNLLKSIRRTTGGADYIRLRAALERLTHTAVRTNIRAEGKKKFASFHWLESWTETVDEATGDTTGMTITLPDWLYDGIVTQGGVLTIHEDYFLLTGGIERWLYRVARKHAGSQATGWSFTMRQLYEKSGSAARFSDFAIDVRRVVKANQLPEYELSTDKNGEGDEIVRFIHRAQLALDHPRRVRTSTHAPPVPGHLRRIVEAQWLVQKRHGRLDAKWDSWVTRQLNRGNPVHAFSAERPSGLWIGSGE